MKRAVGRAYRRIRGAHPRRPKSRTSLLFDIACDLLLTAAAAGMLGGLAVLVWATVSGLRPAQLLLGAALIAVGAGLLLLWERIAWEPFAHERSKDLSEFT